jgi:KDO2-lipid IV(A) lauroyltransferase
MSEPELEDTNTPTEPQPGATASDPLRDAAPPSEMLNVPAPNDLLGTNTPRGYGLTPERYIMLLRMAARVPGWGWTFLCRGAAWWGYWKQQKPVRQWTMNAAVMMGREPTPDEVRAGLRSWCRNMAGSVRLGKYSAKANLKRVIVDQVEFRRFKEAAETTGLVVTMPHMGDWDLCGAWVGANGLKISAVAERLPDLEYRYYSAIRAKVGMTIYAHSDPDAFAKMRHDLETGSVAALVADRDLSHRGVEVVWNTPSGPHTVKMPPGPALLARQTGAQIQVVISTYERWGKMKMRFYPVEVDRGEGGLEVTLQRIADIYAREVAKKPEDWHLMQRFFPGVVAE